MTKRLHPLGASLALAAMLAAAAPVDSLAGEDPLQTLSRARNSLRYGKYGDAIDDLLELLYPLRLDRREDAIEAREMLGVCYFYVGDKDNARSEFVELLKIAPSHRLDPLVHPPPLVEFFDAIRNEIDEELARIRKERLAAEQERKRKEQEAKARGKTKVEKIYFDRHSKRNSLALCFVPFGVGQFQNGENGKGAAFLAGELTLLGLNIATYHAAVGLQDGAGKTPQEDEQLARGLVITQMVSLGALVALAVYGVVDAYLNFTPLVEEVRPRPAPAARPEKAAPPTEPEIPPADGAVPATGLVPFIHASWRF